MRASNLTEHARMRIQQRGISELMVQLIEIFGRHEYQSGGCNHCYIPKKTLSALQKAVNQLDKQSLILAPNGQVVTAQHRHRKVRSKSRG